MNIYKWTITIVLGSVLLLLSAALLLPSSYTVKRSIIINSPASEVYAMVANYKNWERWNPWVPMDASVKIKHSDPSFGVGSSWRWEGNKIGSGKLITLDEIANKKIISQMEFQVPYKMTSNEVWTFEEVEGGTKITWTDSGRLGYPFGRFLGPFLDSKLGPDFERGLANIKAICERK